MSDIEKPLKKAFSQIGAGGTAGFVEICVNHPLDVVKTRFQLQSSTIIPKSKSDPHYYFGIVDCVKKMYRHEGLTSFWKGIVPPIIVETPTRAVKFLAFEQLKKFFMFGSPTPTPLTFALAGLGGGIVEGFIVNPFEVVKVTLQSNRSAMSQLANTLSVVTEIVTLQSTQKSQLPSTWSVAREIVREHGLGSRGLSKGLTATIARHGVFNTVFFCFYYSVKDYIPKYEDPVLEFACKVGIGFTSGVLGSCVNIPFDVAKSRIQGPQPVPGIIKYTSTIGAIRLVYKEEGFRALYKGLLPKVLRIGPGGAITLVVYDYVYNYLQSCQ